MDIKPVTIELQPNAKLYKGRYYSIPKAYEAPTKTEINRLCTIDVMEKLSHDDDSPWASQTFVQPKKTGNI